MGISLKHFVHHPFIGGGGGGVFYRVVERTFKDDFQSVLHTLLEFIYIIYFVLFHVQCHKK